MDDENYVYEGSELALFARAANWKRHWGSVLRRQMGSRVLDVGAGLGGNVNVLDSQVVKEWVCLEPDANMAAHIAGDVRQGILPEKCRVVTGTLDHIPASERFDAILYIDVLEHIENDRNELRNAASHLSPGGRLIVLAPAHQFLYSPFDAAIGHHRRYSKTMLRDLTPEGCCVAASYMLDSVGFFASLANRMLLRRSMPSAEQIAVWDRLLVPLSRLLDPLTFHMFGKTVIVIWRPET